MNGPNDEILEQLTNLDTSHVSDAMDGLGISGQLFGILPLNSGTKLVGQAFTVRYVPVTGTPGNVGDYIDDLPSGTVIVIDNAGRLDATVWGGLLTMTATSRGISGTVIDGVCRDTAIARELAYPIFSRSKWMRTGKGRVRVDSYGESVSIGGVCVEAADYLLGDDDGVVVLPDSKASEIVEIASSIRDTEASISMAIDKGTSLLTARSEHGYHEIQASQGEVS